MAKRVFGYSDGTNDLELLKIREHLYHLKNKGVMVARFDREDKGRAFVGGVEYGMKIGSEKWFNRFMEAKQQLRKLGKVI